KTPLRRGPSMRRARLVWIAFGLRLNVSGFCPRIFLRRTGVVRFAGRAQGFWNNSSDLDVSVVPARHPAPELFRADKRRSHAPAPSAAAVLQWLPSEALAQSSKWASESENRRGEGVLIRLARHVRRLSRCL